MKYEKEFGEIEDYYINRNASTYYGVIHCIIPQPLVPVFCVYFQVYL